MLCTCTVRATLAAASETRVQIIIHLYEFERKSNSLLFASACDGTLSATHSRTTMSCHDLAALSNLLGLKISCQKLSLPHNAMSFQCASAYIAEATARCASSRLRKKLSAAERSMDWCAWLLLSPPLSSWHRSCYRTYLVSHRNHRVRASMCLLLNSSRNKQLSGTLCTVFIVYTEE